jgi:hypothetical protein
MTYLVSGTPEGPRTFCEQTTEAAFPTKYNFLSSRSVDVTPRINDEKPFKEVWRASNGWPRGIRLKRCGICSHAARQRQTVRQDQPL